MFIKRKLMSCALMAVLAVFGHAGAADTDPDRQAALKGLDRVRVVVDVNVGDPKLLLTRMRLLDETYSQLVDSAMTPSVVVAFRGGATPFVTRIQSTDSPETLDAKKEMAQWVALFESLGFTLEVCGIAAEAREIAVEDFLAPVTVVPNGYVSLIGYQNRGYALLPMD